MSRKTQAVVGLVALAVGASASAWTEPFGGSGWQASGEGAGGINFIAWVDDTVFIQKFAEFTQGPDEFGLFPSIPIVFEQVAPSTVNEIVIVDEILTNSTGVDWTEFHWDILDGGGNAWFYSGPDFMFESTPLSNQYFSPDSTSFWVDGYGLGPGGSDAVVPDGSVWFPGDGAIGGELIMEVVSTGSTVFTLDQYPVPEPGTLALLAVGAIGALRRRA
jgi:hypothetical protein